MLRLLMRSDKVWPMLWKSAAARRGFRSRHMTPGKTTRNRARRLRISLASYLPFAWLQAQYGRCEVFEIPDLERALVNPAAVFRSPNNVVDDPILPVDCKREILTRWAWDEYLLQVASDEAMPEGREPSRLDEVKCALLALQEPERRAPVIVSHAPDEVRRAA